MKNAGSYTLRKFLLVPLYSNEEPVDILGLVPSFEIIESIQNDSLRGSALVIDSAGVLEKLPIRGEEHIVIEVEDALGNTKTYQMFLYKVDNIRPASQERAVSYTIYFTSFQRWMAGRNRIIESFSLSPSTIVDKIYKDHYEIRTANGKRVDKLTKPLDVETINGSIAVTIPNMTPMRAMNFIANRTFSYMVGSSNYRFYETSDVFRFKSDEQTYRDAIKNREEIKKFTSGYITRDPQQVGLDDHMANLETFMVSKSIDSAADQINGSYASRGYIMDLNKGEVFPYDFDWDEAKKMMAENSGRWVDRHSDGFIKEHLQVPNQLNFYIVQTYDPQNPASGMGDQKYPQIAASKTAYLNQIRALTVISKGHGRLDVTCGDVIDVTIKEFVTDTSETAKENKQLSGEYIVDTVTKVFDKETATNNYVLIKKGFRK